MMLTISSIHNECEASKHIVYVFMCLYSNQLCSIWPFVVLWIQRILLYNLIIACTCLTLVACTKLCSCFALCVADVQILCS